MKHNPVHHLVPMIVVDDAAVLDELRAFYGSLPGAAVDIDMPAYLQLRFEVDDPARQAPALAFMTSTSTAALGVAQSSFSGAGLVVSVPVADADTHHEALSRAEVAKLTTPMDKPWGWRSFLVRDPAGVTLDFFHVRSEADAVDAAS